MRKLFSAFYCLLLVATATQALANAQQVGVQGDQIVRSVSGVVPDAAGNANTGCLFFGPINLGTNMAFNGMTGGCSTVTIGPLETQAQSATDIAAALAAFAPAVPISAAIARTYSLATAYQCTNTAKACLINLNVQTATSITLGTGTTNTATIVVGATNGVAGGTGTAVGVNSNAITGAGLSLGFTSVSSVPIFVPIGYFFAIRATSGTVTIPSAFEQQIG